MASISLTAEERSGFTQLPDIFIDEYMNDANEVQLKLYLYLLRRLEGNEGVDLSEAADFLNFPEREILRALRFWEKKQVLSISLEEGLDVSDGYDADSICGLRMENIMTPCANRNKKTGEVSAVMDDRKTEESGAENRKSAADIKNSYTPEDIEKFAEDGRSKILITAAQLYYGRTLGATEIQSLMYLAYSLEMPVELIDYLMQYCVEMNKKSFYEVEKIAGVWKDAGVDTIDKAKQFVKGENDDPDAREKNILAMIGRTGNISPAELDAVRQWTGTYGFSDDIIREACGRAAMRVQDIAHAYSYADKILKDWFYRGVRELKDIESLDAEHNDRKDRPGRTTGSRQTKKGKGAFDNLMESDTDYAELDRMIEKKLFS
ncbi:MAG: DnaD domain protein [Lachnospiraceae bacterium]|nr:DnaD domain protein [Lachnospiraceae bacterium]